MTCHEKMYSEGLGTTIESKHTWDGSFSPFGGFLISSTMPKAFPESTIEK